jgi:ISXO2-like transposase domain
LRANWRLKVCKKRAKSEPPHCEAHHADAFKELLMKGPGAVSRKGNVVARVVANVTSDTLTAFVREAVSHKVSLLCTDQWAGYGQLGKEYPHGVVDHAKGRYVIGAIHTNTIEGFWSIFKRGVVGTFHKMSRKYMPLYVAEFQFRYNNRENTDIFGTAIKGC